MAKANFDNWRTNLTFSDWERICLLAGVEPLQEMSADELSQVQRVRGVVDTVKQLSGDPKEAGLFKRLLAF